MLPQIPLDDPLAHHLEAFGHRVGPSEVGRIQIRPGKVSPSHVRPAEPGPSQVRREEDGVD
jgi:hypothetical protein